MNYYSWIYTVIVTDTKVYYFIDYFSQDLLIHWRQEMITFLSYKLFEKKICELSDRLGYALELYILWQKLKVFVALLYHYEQNGLEIIFDDYFCGNTW